MATATVIVSRKWGGLMDRNRKWQVVLDGTAAGSIAVQQTIELPVEPGRHTLRLRSTRRLVSRERSFEVAEGDAARFSCRAQLFWPMQLAALVKPDLWISLRRDFR